MLFGIKGGEAYFYLLGHRPLVVESRHLQMKLSKKIRIGYRVMLG
jgi:hypothetical protein